MKFASKWEIHINNTYMKHKNTTHAPNQRTQGGVYLRYGVRKCPCRVLLWKQAQKHSTFTTDICWLKLLASVSDFVLIRNSENTTGRTVYQRTQFFLSFIQFWVATITGARFIIFNQYSCLSAFIICSCYGIPDYTRLNVD